VEDYEGKRDEPFLQAERSIMNQCQGNWVLRSCNFKEVRWNRRRTLRHTLVLRREKCFQTVPREPKHIYFSHAGSTKSDFSTIIWWVYISPIFWYTHDLLTLLILSRYPLPTSQNVHSISVTKIILLMLFREMTE
jgi:hypothetical protein